MGGLVIIVGEGGCAEMGRLRGLGSRSKVVVLAGFGKVGPKGWAIEFRRRVRENCHYYWNVCFGRGSV